MENIFWVVKDEEGILRPMAGIWRDDQYGKMGADTYAKKNPSDELVKVEIKELK